MSWPVIQVLLRRGKTTFTTVFLLGVVFVCIGWYQTSLSASCYRCRAVRTFSYRQVTKPCHRNNNRLAFIRLLRHWELLSERNDVKYVLAMGSLLGQFRNGDVIPWDQDVDVLVDAVYYRTLRKLAHRRNFKQDQGHAFRLVVHPEFENKVEDDRGRWSCEGKKVPEQMDSCSFVQPLGRLVYGFMHLDIFHFTRAGQRLDVPDIGVHYNRTDFYPFVRCKFMSVSTWCPNKRENVLKKRYGEVKPEYVCKKGQWVRQE